MMLRFSQAHIATRHSENNLSLYYKERQFAWSIAKIDTTYKAVVKYYLVQGGQSHCAAGGGNPTRPKGSKQYGFSSDYYRFLQRIGYAKDAEYVLKVRVIARGL